MTNPFDPLLSLLSNKAVYSPIIVVVVSFVVYYIVRAIVDEIINHDKSNSYMAKKRRTVVDLICNIIKYIIIVVAIIAILQIYGINTQSIIASLGVASAVLGLAFQDALKDFIGGITIILENYYIVGDYITINDFTGRVISLGLKCTKVQNFKNEVLVIANRNVTQVINISQSKANVIITMPVAYEVPTAQAEKAINDCLIQIKKIKSVVPDTVKYLGIDSLSSSSVDYLITFISVHEEQWQAKRDALKIIKNTFDAEKIKIPYDQIEVHNG
jgi:moderate conductance mechanosensitive channel